MIRNPSGSAIRGEEFFLNRFDFHEPRRNRAVNERRVRARAEGIGVDEGVLLYDSTGFFQVRDNLLVRILHPLARVWRNVLREHAIVVDRVYDRNAVLLAS